MIIHMFCALCLAQVNTATIYGTVSDPSDAAVPAANVIATNEHTGGTRTTTTNDDGEFAFTFLPVGKYSIVIAASGFKEEHQTGLELSAGEGTAVKIRAFSRAGDGTGHCQRGGFVDQHGERRAE